MPSLHTNISERIGQRVFVTKLRAANRVSPATASTLHPALRIASLVYAKGGAAGEQFKKF